MKLPRGMFLVTPKSAGGSAPGRMPAVVSAGATSALEVTLVAAAEGAGVAGAGGAGAGVAGAAVFGAAEACAPKAFMMAVVSGDCPDPICMAAVFVPPG